MTKFSKAWQCHKCPESGGRDGCPAWRHYPNSSGGFITGCGLAQEISIGISNELFSSAIAAAASADKAANHAEAAKRAAELCSALMLGFASGEITPPRRLEAPDDAENYPLLGPVHRQ